MSAFPLRDQQRVIDLIRPELPPGADVIVVFVIRAPEHGDNAATLSTFATLPPEPAYAALTNVVLRHLKGEAPEPIELGRLQ